MTVTRPVTPPVMPVEMLLPESWWLVDPSSGRRRERSIAALVAQELGRADDRAALRAEARAALGRQAREAAQAGAFLLALSLMRWGDLPLPGAVAGYRVPRAGGDELRSLEKKLADGPGAVELATTERGSVLRRTGSVDAARDAHVPGAQLFRADYWLDLPGAEDIVLLTFGTPLVGAADGFLDLFDAIVDTVRITDTSTGPIPGRDVPAQAKGDA